MAAPLALEFPERVREVLAVHEASHAVVGRPLGRPPGGCTISGKDGDWAGLAWEGDLDLNSVDTERAREATEKACQTARAVMLRRRLARVMGGWSWVLGSLGRFCSLLDHSMLKCTHTEQ